MVEGRTDESKLFDGSQDILKSGSTLVIQKLCLAKNLTGDQKNSHSLMVDLLQIHGM